MANFISRVEDYIGTFSDTTAVDQWLTQGSRLVIDRLPPNRAVKYSKPITDAGSGVDITQYKVFDAHKSNYQARLVPSGMAAAVVDSSSIHYALSTNPAWYILNGKAYVKPSGGTLIGLEYPNVVNTQSAILNFPDELINGVILYAAIHGLLQNINTLLKTTIGDISYTAPTNVTAPSAPSFVYADVSYTDASYTDASYTSSLYTNALIDTITSTTIDVDAISTPTYTKPTFSGSYTDMETALTNQDIELAEGEGRQLDRYLQNFGVDVQNELNEFNKETVIYQTLVNKVIEQARLDQQRLIEQSRLQIELNLRNAKEASDVLLQNAIKTADINAINEAKTMELDIMNKAKALEVDIINKTKELERQITEYQSKLQKYSADIQDYAAQVNEEVNRIQVIIAQYSTMLGGYFNLLGSLKTEYKEIMESI